MNNYLLKKIFLFLILSFVFQFPSLLASGCESFLKSKGFYKYKYLGNMIEAKYAFHSENPDEEWTKLSNPWTIDAWKKFLNSLSVSWIECNNDKAFEGNITYCNGKPFFEGDPSQNMYSNRIYDKNGNKWSVFRRLRYNLDTYSISECFFDQKSGYYYDITSNDIDLNIPEANNNIWIKRKIYSFYEKGIKPSF